MKFISASEALKIALENNPLVKFINYLNNEIKESAEKGDYFTYISLGELNTLTDEIIHELEDVGYHVELLQDHLQLYIQWKHHEQDGQ